MTPPIRTPSPGESGFGEPGTLCFLCGTLIESVNDRIEWHGLGNCVEICAHCGGAGGQGVDHAITVSHDMAVDAGDPSMEGLSMHSGSEWVGCSTCGGLGGVPFAEGAR